MYFALAFSAVPALNSDGAIAPLDILTVCDAKFWLNTYPTERITHLLSVPVSNVAEAFSIL